MDKKVYATALERAGGHICELIVNGERCGSNHYVTLHHIIFGNGKRIQCERLSTIIFLCYFHHQQPKTGVHSNARLNAELHILASNRLKAEGLTGEQLKKALGGRFYE